MIDDLRQQIQNRLDELDGEADRLRQALDALGSESSARSRRPASRARRTSPARRTARPRVTDRGPRPGATRRSAGNRARARRGETRSAVLASLTPGNMLTAAQVAQKTGLERGTVAATLSRLAKTPQVEKAERGYRLTGRA